MFKEECQLALAVAIERRSFNKSRYGYQANMHRGVSPAEERLLNAAERLLEARKPRQKVRCEILGPLAAPGEERSR